MCDTLQVAPGSRADSVHSNSSAAAARKAPRADSAHSTSSARAGARGLRADDDEFDLEGFEEISGSTGISHAALPEPLPAPVYPQVTLQHQFNASCSRLNQQPSILDVSICACHLCATAMLTLSVPFLF